MNHRRAEHPSNKICRYYQMDACDFNEDTCWYRHEEKKKHSKKVVDKIIECEVCEEKFEIKDSYMKHMKSKHKNRVQQCRKYANKNCNLKDSSCWFIHNEIVEKEKNVEEMEVDDIKKQTEVFFREAMEKRPPDQMERLMEIVMNLSKEVQDLRRITKLSK